MDKKQAQMPKGPIAIDGKTGLHRLGPLVKNLSRMRENSDKLQEKLKEVLDRTYEDAPLREQGYKLDRDAGKLPHANQVERRLEKAIWEQYGPQSPKKKFHETCPWIQTYQMPLQKQRRDEGWGKIDLVGISEKGLPVVLELKIGTSREAPLRMLVEGLAYAVALRRAWHQGALRNEWAAAIKEFFTDTEKRDFDLQDPNFRIPVIGIAPKEYWDQRINKPGPGHHNIVHADAWKQLKDLCDACLTQGYPVSFLRFTANTQNGNHLPRIEAVEAFDIPN